MKLNDKLNSLTSYPFHMPGHKRNINYKLPSCDIDITEINGFDNLHEPKEILMEMQDDIAKIYESKKSIISVNGSTCCILSAICGICKKGDKILIARNCHKSVYNACFIHELKIEYIEPEFDEEFGIFTRVTQKAVDISLKRHPDAAAIVITSPTYEGVVSRICADIPVIVDAAHGSHFGLADYIPERTNADVVINSLHKTLPCLTQCAVVHIYSDAYCSNIKRYMDIFETSSPSYILMSSIDKCIDFLKDCKKQFDEYELLLNAFYNELGSLNNIHLFDNDDITRIVLKVSGYTGHEISEILSNNGIEIEAAGLDYVILISTVCDSEHGFKLLINALKQFENRKKQCKHLAKPILPSKAYEQFEVTDTNITQLDKSIGMVCGESIFAYPPDIPIITAGEIIDSNTINYIRQLIENGVNVLSDSDLLPDRILTKPD